MVSWFSRITLVALVALLTGCAVIPLASQPEVLRIGVTANYPPMIFKVGEEFRGAEADCGNLLAKALQREPQFVEYPWEGLISALVAGKIDIIMSGMSITDARKVRIDFTEPYMRGGLMALMRAEDKAKYPTLDSIMQSIGNVGVVKGTTGEVFVRRNFIYAQSIIPLTKAADSISPIKNQRLDLFVHDAPSIAWLVSENEAEVAGFWEPFNEEYMAWAVNRGNQELLVQVNALLRKWKNDGTLSGILKHWLPYLK